MMQNIARTSHHSPANKSMMENNYDLYGLGVVNTQNPNVMSKAKLTSEVNEAYNNDLSLMVKPLNTTFSRQIASSRYRNNQTVRPGSEVVEPLKPKQL
jgi:hypothetical protein